MNAKFVYVGRHVRPQIRPVYRYMLQQLCYLERSVLRNSLAIALIAPDQFKYNSMGGPVYYVQLTGEVVYVIKYLPIEVQAEKSRTCHQQLQVTHNGVPWFLQPRTHILIRIPLELICNEITPPMWKIDHAWYKLLPNAVKALAPRIVVSHKQET